MMKMILAVYNVAIDDEVMEAVQKVGVVSYTKWPRVIGQGRNSGPHLDDHVWPGANAMMMIVTSAEKAPEVMETLQVLRNTIGKTEGIKAFLLNVESQL